MNENFVQTFYYTESMGKHEELLRQKLTDFRCKHVMCLASKKAVSLLNESARIGYEQVMWGYDIGTWQDESENRAVQMENVRRMIYKKRIHPFRVVIDDGGIPWIDNLHSAIRDILAFGENARLMDARFYVIDMSGEVPVVINHESSLHKDLDDVLGAIAVARKRNGRTNECIRKIGYTIGEFMEENEISRTSLRLDEKYYADYACAFQAARNGGGRR